MTIVLNHTIVPARDKKVSARFSRNSLGSASRVKTATSHLCASTRV